jgi:hypothetical protein
MRSTVFKRDKVIIISEVQTRLVKTVLTVNEQMFSKYVTLLFHT